MKKESLNCPFCHKPYDEVMLKIWKSFKTEMIKKHWKSAKSGVVCSSCGETIWKIDKA